MMKTYLKKSFFVLVAGLMACTSLSAQGVLLDDHSNSNGATTWNITTSHPNELILIAADGYGFNLLSTAPGTVTVNGNNATYITAGHWFSGDSWVSTIWAYPAPTAGTYTLTCTESGLSSPFYLNFATSVYEPGAALGLGDILIGGYDSNQAMTTITTTITTTKANSFVFGTTCWNDNGGTGTLNWNGGLTELDKLYVDNGVDAAQADSTIATPGLQTVTVTDIGASNTWATITLIAVQPKCSLAADSVTNVSTCQGNCTNISVAFTGGTPQYTYSWNTGGTTDTINVCPAADSNYTLTITDSNGCMSMGKVKVKVNPLPTAMMSITKDTTCVSMTKDSLIGSPLGGTFSGAGVTGSNFDPSAAGIGAHTITYTYTDSAGCSASDSAWVMVSSCTGINEVSSLDNLVNFYPNPFAENLTINVGISGPVTITMFNTMGQNVGSWQMKQGMHTINTGSLPAGVYSMQVKTKAGLVNKKLVKVN